MKQLMWILLLCAGAVCAQDKVNLVLILADDLGWADVSPNGHTTFYKTPNLERLAKRGMLFTQAYSASPLCSPTRASIMTGLSPARTGITAPVCHEGQEILECTQPAKNGAPNKKTLPPIVPTRLKTTYPTVAKAFKAAGYATGHFGKWHLGREPYSPLQHGFDVDIPHWPGPGPAGSFVAPWKFDKFDPDPGEPNQHIEDRMAKEAVKWLEQNKGKPFYMNYWMFSVHAPFDAKKALIEKYQKTVDKRDLQRCPTYAAMIESMDDAVGTLMDALDRLDLSKNTLVVFTADNGGNMYNEVEGESPTSNRPLRGGKATMFEGGVRVPCIISWPGVVKAGAKSDVRFQTEDYFPTFIEAFGLQKAPGQIFDGVSVLPAWKGDTAFVRAATFTYFPHDPGVPDWMPPAVAVHDGDWKLIRIFNHGENNQHRYQLYNLKDDLSETNNLAALEPARVKDLDAKIEAFLVDTKAVLPRINPAFDPAKYDPKEEGVQKPKAKATPSPKGQDAGDDPKLQGWKMRSGTATVKKGILTVKSAAEAKPFLGVGCPSAGGGGKVELRVKCAQDGAGKIEWLKSPGESNTSSVNFEVKGGDWQTITVTIPETASMGILRVYVPAGQSVDIDWIDIQLNAAGSKSKRTEF
jgi:arylsulfatase A-like enzyme